AFSNYRHRSLFAGSLLHRGSHDGDWGKARDCAVRNNDSNSNPGECRPTHSVVLELFSLRAGYLESYTPSDTDLWTTMGAQSAAQREERQSVHIDRPG